MHCGNKLVTMCVWLITALAAIHLGLIGLGIDIWQHPIVQDHEFLRKAIIPIHWIIGLAGVWSLISYVQWAMSGYECACHCKK